MNDNVDLLTKLRTCYLLAFLLLGHDSDLQQKGMNGFQNTLNHHSTPKKTTSTPIIGGGFSDPDAWRLRRGCRSLLPAD
jgi:hypothetical protein